MNNTVVMTLLDECDDELNRIETIINGIGATSKIVPFLNKYAIVRACGTIEVAYKSLVADFCDWRSKTQLKTYVTKKVRESSKNPSYSAICGLLKDFDDNWNITFRTQIDAHPHKSRIITSVDSLVGARNEFAHGGNPSSTVSDVKGYFADSRILMDILDGIVV